MTESRSDTLGTLRWQGIEGVIIPSKEGYGVIFTADPERVIVTIPFEATKGITNETSNAEAQMMLTPMFEQVIDMFVEMGQSKDPE